MPLDDKDWVKLNKITDPEARHLASITLGNVATLHYSFSGRDRIMALRLIFDRVVVTIEAVYDEVYPETKEKP